MFVLIKKVFNDQVTPIPWYFHSLVTFTAYFFSFIYIYIFFLHLYWSIIALHCFVSCCCITKWISYMYTYIPVSPPSCVSLPPTLPIPPLYVVTEHRADLPVLCGCFPLAIYFTFGSVYMSMLFFHFVPAYPSTPNPAPCPQVHSLRLHLYSCPASRFIRTIFVFRFHIYALACGICFSLSDLLHCVWQTLGPSTTLVLII